MIYYRVYHDPDRNQYSPCYRYLGAFTSKLEAIEAMRCDVRRRVKIDKNDSYKIFIFAEYQIIIDAVGDSPATSAPVDGLTFIKEDEDINLF